MKETMTYRSREKRGNHAVIVVNAKSKENAQKCKEEIRKASRRMRHLLDGSFSYEAYLVFDDPESFPEFSKLSLEIP